MCSADSLVDVAVEIPKACWQSLDFLNHRYHRKRAFYLACIAHALLESDLVSEMKFSLQNDCYLSPVLRIIPKDISQFTVNLTAYPNEQAFKLNRFIPVRNNVRSSWMLGIEEDRDIPTPHYNAIILADVLLPKLNNYLKEEITAQNVKDGLILLKLWCRQRALTMGYGRLNGFILTMLVSYLLKKQKINSAMNAYQIFRCSLLALHKENLLEFGISLCEEAKSDLSLEEFKKAYQVVFVEISGFLNICYAVTEETYKMVQHEAKLGLQILDKESPDSFSLLFMHRITFSKK
ncbi:Nucleolar protein 6, partial [Stegodyphus mimosarum]